MDLNVGSSELFENNDMVFPIETGRENLKILISPGSESSGVSSLDADEAKKIGSDHSGSSSSPILTSESGSRVQTSSESSDTTTDLENVFVDNADEQKVVDSKQSVHEHDDQSNADSGKRDENNAESDESLQAKQQQQPNNEMADQLSASIDNSAVCVGEHKAAAPSLTPTTGVNVADNNNKTNDDNETVNTTTNNNDDANDDTDEKKVTEADIIDDIRYKNLRIMHEGRDILNFEANVSKSQSWSIQYANLPETNFNMFMANRSQYHRLAPDWQDAPDQLMEKCGKCDFHIPANMHNGKQPVDEPTTLVSLMKSLTMNNATGCTTPAPTAVTAVQPPNHSPNSSVGQSYMQQPPTPMPMNRISPINTLKALSQKLAQAGAPVVNQASPFMDFVNGMPTVQPNVNNMNGNVNQYNQWRQPVQHQGQQNAVLNGLVNNNAATLNALAAHLNNSGSSNGGNSVAAAVAAVAANQFNPNMLNAMNGGNANQMADMLYNMNNLNTNNFNRLMNTASMPNQMQNRQLHGMCRQNSNKSGINFNGNMNQNKLPQFKMYTHF